MIIMYTSTRFDIVSISTVKLLISYGASVNQKDGNGNTPLHLGMSSKPLDCCDIALSCSSCIETTKILLWTT